MEFRLKIGLSVRAGRAGTIIGKPAWYVEGVMK